jgi:putative acetyltransferase
MLQISLSHSSEYLEPIVRGLPMSQQQVSKNGRYRSLSQDMLCVMNTGEVLIRREQPDDVGGVRVVNEAAFGRSEEADLVDRLRQEGAVLASFVAVQNLAIIGHVLFSRTLIEAADEQRVLSVALAPVAVLPLHQRRGVGGQLIRSGLDWLRTRGEQSVLVLGDPRYYPRFGFCVARARLLTVPFPPGAFMALELVPGALDGIRGAVRYPAAFGL